MTNNKFFIFLICFIALLGCKKKTNTQVDNKGKVEDSTIKNDTIFNQYSYLDYVSEEQRADTILLINDEEHKLIYSSKTETKIFYIDTSIYTEKGKIHHDTYKGFNNTYTISLKDNTEELIFTTTITKENFRNIFDEYILAKSESYLPDFIGYVKSFRSFIFTVNFWIPDSDVGGQCFFMINDRGELTNVSLNNYYGGGDCYGEIEIPENENFILTCRKIYKANGDIVDITSFHVPQIGTKLINDNTILVIQEYNDSLKIPNAVLMDNSGKSLKSFVYKGYYNVLGYTVPWYFDSLCNNYIFLDEEQKNIRVMSKDRPLSTYTVGFSKMKPYKEDQLENELVFNLNTEFSENTFAFDTLKRTFRLRQKK